MPSPKYEETPESIKPEDYYPLKEHRFACFNPPNKEQFDETHKKRVTFNCACPMNDQQQ
jgi:hypothetical protein